MNFSEEQIERYSRQIILKEVGVEGQERIMKGKVLVIGAGGLGAPASLYLAAAGIGTLGIVDSDKVDLSNLQRQILHFTADVGRDKTESAGETLRQINPDVEVVTYNERVYADNITDIINDRDYDFIIDGTDNFPAKFLINDASVFNKKAFSHAGILRFSGQTITYLPGHTCYRCLFDSPPPKGAVPSCSEAGILGAVAGIMGTVQAAEALKYILGYGELLTDRLFHIDIETMNFRSINVKRNPRCPICGDNPSVTDLTDHEQPVCDLKDRKS